MNHTIFSIVDRNNKKVIQSSYEKLSKEYQEQIKIINTLYENKYFIGLQDNRKLLKAKNLRKCRFCGRTYKEVKFSKKAHIIPEFLGNKNFLSDFECDDCNWKFGVYENDFANFIGIYRTFALLSGKNGIPKFKSQDKELWVDFADDGSFNLGMNDFSYIDENITYDEKKDIFRIRAKGSSFIPMNVFKCLLKLGLSFVDESELKYLKETLNFLNDHNNSLVEDTKRFILKIHQCFVPGNIDCSPFIILYKKRDLFIGFPAPTFALIIYINNLTLQIFIPFHKSDDLIYKKDTKRELFLFPPLIKNDWIMQYGEPFTRLGDFSDNKIIKDMYQYIEFKDIS